jgi:hypothetical protein
MVELHLNMDGCHTSINQLTIYTFTKDDFLKMDEQHPHEHPCINDIYAKWMNAIRNK